MTTVIDNAKKEMQSRKATFEFWMNNGCYFDDYQGDEVSIVEGFQRLGDLHEYGLSFEFVSANENVDGHFCYLLSTGGPHEEIRFFPDGKIEFVSKPWFSCHKIDVTRDAVYTWVRDYFNELDMLNFESHYDELYLWDTDTE